MSDARADTPKIVLAGVFITGLITAQLVAVKLLEVPFPDAVPVVGDAVLVPAGVVAYAVTFLASDCYAELYGKRPTQVVVNTAFGMNVVMLALVWLAIFLPGSQAGVDPGAFETVLGLSTNVVIGSLAAYVVSQNWDVIAFHAIGDRTEGQHLWLRNLGSTSTSQFIDTVIFVTVTFFVVPQVLGIGDVLATSVLVELIVGQYLIKLLIALLDTPIVYAVVGYTGRQKS
ncbi:MAG: queuosine precursor transporter [Halobacteriales archaeon]